jgi:hypothetical protein
MLAMILRRISYTGAIVLLSSLLVTETTATPSPKIRRLLPVDEAAKDPSFVTFRASLIKIVDGKDRHKLLKILDPQIKSSFGGNGGIREFKEYWKIESPNSRLWGVLKTVLSMGGTFSSRDQFCAPYVFASFPEELDSFEWVAIIAVDVPLRSEAHPDAPIIARLSHALVRKLGDDEDGKWINVEAVGIGKGFVDRLFVRSPLDWRACFSKRKNGWVMASLLDGD